MRTIAVLLTMLLFLPVNAQRNETGGGWYVEGYNDAKARSYIDNNYYLDKIEGIWQSSDGYKYAIVKDVVDGKSSSTRFRMIILESSFNGWSPTEIKAFIEKGSIPTVYSMKYYLKSEDRTGLSSENIFLTYENQLMMTFQRLDGGEEITLYKLYPEADKIEESKTQEEIVEEEVAEWTGTCFAIGKNWVATNYHVVEGVKNLVVCGVDGDKNANYTAEIVLTDKYNDLAIMRISDHRFRGFNIRYGVKTNVSEIGTEVFVLGYPLTMTMGEDIKLTTGVISSKTGFQGDVSLYQISAPIQPGNSGGPLFDKEGNLIGVVNAKHKGAENVGYAIKLSYLKNLIDSSDEKIELSSSNTISASPLTEKVKAISSCVLLVKANTQIKTTPKVSKNTNEGAGAATIEDDKIKAQNLLESSLKKYETNDFEGAYKDACESVKLYPTPMSQYTYGYLAWSYVNDADVALEAFEYCLEKGYKEDACIYFLARCHMAKEDYSRAISYLNMAIENNRKDVQSIELRGICKDEMGKEDEAVSDYLQAIKFDGIVDYDYSNLYNNMAYHMMSKSKFEDSKMYIEKALKHNSLYGNAWDTYGELNYRLDNYEECVRCMNIAITNGHIYKGNWMENSYLYRGLAKKELGCMAGAYQDIEKAVELEREGAAEELAKIDVSSIDFSEDHTFNKMIPNPIIKKKSNINTEIRGVEITDEFTAIHICYQNTKYDYGGWYSMDRTAYIRDKSTGRKYKLIAAENCAISPQKTAIEKDEKKIFTLYFEPIPSTTREIDFIESDNSTWKFYGIKLVEK